MYNAQSLAMDLDAAILASSHEWRISALRQVASLFAAGAAGYLPVHVDIFDTVMLRLTDGDISEQALVELSTRLARIENAPPATVGRLSRHGSIRVAGLPLERSLLSDTTLIEIATTAGVDHLLAIAGRADINANVCDTIINRNILKVTLKLLRNPGAHLSEVSFVKLCSEAGQDENIAGALVGRHDLPEELRPFLSLAVK